jgi:hypothetical protein
MTEINNSYMYVYYSITFQFNRLYLFSTCFKNLGVRVIHGSVAVLLTVFQYRGSAMKELTVQMLLMLMLSSAVRWLSL